MRTHIAAAVILSAAAASAATTYYFRFTAIEPASSDPALDPRTPLHPFFTGAQALTNLHVSADTTSAEISWQGNVIGFGKLEFGTSTLYGEAGIDTASTKDHAFSLFGLQPATKYFYRLSNVETIDGESIASITGSFDTLPTISAHFLQPLHQSTSVSKPLVNIHRNGKVISVKVRLTQGSTVLTAKNAPGPVAIGVTRLASCHSKPGTDGVESQLNAETDQFHFDTGSQSWTYGLDPRALGLSAGNCYRVDVYVDGSKVSNAFAVFQPTK